MVDGSEDLTTILERSVRALQEVIDARRDLDHALARLGTASSGPLGVSAIVRVQNFPANGRLNLNGKIGLVVAQAPSGADRYTVMFPGDPAPYGLKAVNLIVLSGIDPDIWWRL